MSVTATKPEPVNIQAGELRQARRNFLVALEPVRPAVYRYCRRLTGTVWDAEDLLQETLVKALSDASQRHEPTSNVEAWLIRIATNTWLDTLRRSGRTAVQDFSEPGADVPDDGAADPLTSLEVESALEHLLLVLPPRERVCVVLKDVFRYSLAEIAETLDTTAGAVKSALHRGRSTLATARAGGSVPADDDGAAAGSGTKPPQPEGHPELLRRLADAFNSYDIDAMVSLFLTGGRTVVIGNVSETGHEEIRTGSMTHTFGPDAAELYRASVHSYDGEDVILLWERPKDAPETPEVVADVLRLSGALGEPLIAELRLYFFCPEVLAEVAGGLGLPFKTNGVSYF
ncbi:sigma-70 family RNA polymerase sigma factor [Arthrobacter sp. zg-Y859]|uniref:RNA polymerase sigma factor n=1 Tax=Arthrobacter jinronghuae TaxID=2964609 RepID=A0ABT1NUZ5_9MICC|nr:sigma-70 family RNA polymerase sigma factor [Arthrobacter jinronghuae]MCQ1950304.1 sigma-70 family RNA polymerase sigma factor [Arthrobacter jinronghuae]UWX77284.1 sigma-70 family RNA polymerase sigma factor [Arthrobacter jinronghuae]